MPGPPTELSFEDAFRNVKQTAVLEWRQRRRGGGRFAMERLEDADVENVVDAGAFR
jgi:hypothetical protein